MLTQLHLIALAPFVLVCATAVTVMLGIAWRRQHQVTVLVSVLGLVLALIAWGYGLDLAELQSPLLVFDSLAVGASLLVLLCALATVFLARAYFAEYPGPREEFYLLLLCGTAGGLILVSSHHLASLFFGLELVSMPLYGMLAYRYRQGLSLEAGVKYLILSAAASAFMLFGMALLYSQTGNLDFLGLGLAMPQPPGAWALAGAVMMLVGLAFKLSVVPFHLWTADVYQGGPLPAVSFLATVSKLAVFVVLLRLVYAVPAFRTEGYQVLWAVLAIITMLGGNILALLQNNLKRLLGYSSIAHFGYLLVVLAVADRFALETSGIYLATYLAATLGAFGVLSLVSSPVGDREISALDQYRGLFWRRPYLAAALTVFLLSLAGIPFTAGFIGKFYIVALGVTAGTWWLVAAIVAGSAIGLYYYLRVMVSLYLRDSESPRLPSQRSSRLGQALVIGLALLVIVLGVYPTPLIDWMATLAL